MSNIWLQTMTMALCKAYLQEFTHDRDLFMEDQPFTEYIYSDAKAEAYFQRHRDLNRVHLAIMLADQPIGEIIFKNIDQQEKNCTMGICLQKDAVKNKGCGTTAERMALDLVFGEMGIKTVFADALKKNTRSQHVLEKVGFRKTHWDDNFVYYRCDAAWNDSR